MVLDERGRLLKAMRSRAQEDVAAGKKKIAAETEAARVEVERNIPALAGEIARLIIERPEPSPGGYPR